MKVRVRALKDDIGWGNESYDKNAIFELEEKDLSQFTAGEVCLITGRETFTMDDMYAMADWSTNPFIEDRRVFESKFTALEKQIQTLTDINLLLEEKLHEARK